MSDSLPVIGSPAFQRALPFVRDQLIPAYAGMAPLSFAYCQGSMVENLSDTSDVDVVFVWEAGVPDQDGRLPSNLNDASPSRRIWQRQETFHVAGQDYGLAHHTVADWERWMAELQAGGGCDGYPMPVIAAHGLQHGLLVYDPRGTGAELKRRLDTFPERLRTAPAARAREATPDYLSTLEACARLNDGLLFNGELVRAEKLLWTAWFSSRGLYWPLEKRLTIRLRSMGRDDLTTAEERVWASGPSLTSRLNAFRQLAEMLLAELPA